MKIRPILPGDNRAICDIIQSVILEYGAPQKGTAYSDAATQHMYEYYQQARRCYYVIDDDGVVVGGAGVGPLDNSKGNICELQKMYFLPIVRGKGYGKKMMDLCLQRAVDYKYSQVYLETMNNMIEAQGLYRYMSFDLLEKPMGNTGHYSCPVQMIKTL